MTQVVEHPPLALEIGTRIVEAVEKRGGTEEDIRFLLQPDGKRLIGSLATKLKRSGLERRNCYPITLQYDQYSPTKMVEEMIAEIDLWKYDQAVTTEHFPISGKGEVKLVVSLLKFTHRHTFPEVKEAIRRKSLTPASIEHLLALHSAYPYLREEYTIGALGSAWVSQGWFLADKVFYPFLVYRSVFDPMLYAATEKDVRKRKHQYVRFAAIQPA